MIPKINFDETISVSSLFIAICDDEELYRRQCRIMCASYFERHNQKINILEFSSTEELMAYHNKLYIIFLDIELPGLSGIEAREMLSSTQPEAAIIFITSHPESMPGAFGKNVYYFLQKPLVPEELYYALKHVSNELMAREDFITVENKKVILSQIVYIKADDKYVNLMFFLDKPVIIRGTMNEWEMKLKDKNFVRMHKSYIINMMWIRSINKNLQLQDGTIIHLTKSTKHRIREAYSAYLNESSY